MPPKKKRCAPPLSKPGIGKQHLLDHFSQLPPNGDFLNGHVLYLYSCKCNSTRSSTAKELLHLLPSGSLTSDKTISTFLDANIKRVVLGTLKKFRKLSCKAEFDSFCDICKKKFPCHPVVVTVDLQHDISHQEPEPKSLVLNPVPKSPLKTRQVANCANCKRLRDSRTEMRKKLTEMQRDKIVAIRNTKIQQKKKGAIKILNQSIKRKNEQIKCYKAKASALISAQKTMEKKHNLMKQYYKEKMSLQTNYDERISYLERKLAEQEEEKGQLQIDKMILEKKVQEMEDVSKATKLDGKSYTADIRMMVFDAIENQVPAKYIPKLIKNFFIRMMLTDIPHRSTVENMARELGSIAELQTAEALLENKKNTVGFEATTQEGTHTELRSDTFLGT